MTRFCLSLVFFSFADLHPKHFNCLVNSNEPICRMLADKHRHRRRPEQERSARINSANLSINLQSEQTNRLSIAVRLSKSEENNKEELLLLCASCCLCVCRVAFRATRPTQHARPWSQGIHQGPVCESDGRHSRVSKNQPDMFIPIYIPHLRTLGDTRLPRSDELGLENVVSSSLADMLYVTV